MCKKCLKMRLLFAGAGFLLGAASGAGIATLAARKKIKEQDAEIETLLSELNEYSAHEFGKLIVKEKKKYDAEHPEETPVNPLQDERQAAAVVAHQRYAATEKPSLESLVKQDPDESPDEEDEEYLEIEREKHIFEDTDEKLSDPHQIDLEDFMVDDSFDKDQLTFYVHDETLCDSDDDILPIDVYIGGDNFLDAVKKSIEDGEAMLYWRNEQLDTDFEIEIKDASYNSTVLGIDDDAVAGFEKKAKRRKKSEDE